MNDTGCVVSWMSFENARIVVNYLLFNATWNNMHSSASEKATQCTPYDGVRTKFMLSSCGDEQSLAQPQLVGDPPRI